MRDVTSHTARARLGLGFGFGAQGREVLGMGVIGGLGLRAWGVGGLGCWVWEYGGLGLRAVGCWGLGFWGSGQGGVGNRGLRLDPALRHLGQGAENVVPHGKQEVDGQNPVHPEHSLTHRQRHREVSV
ncbi:hypothetical protein ANANG_G00094200, partial [Anguilla anguilla]